MRRLLAAISVLLALSSVARADGPWSGYWATAWRDGGARLQLDQQGDEVTGTYPLYGGRIEGTVNGERLEGKWSEGDRSGSFVFVMGRDRDSFSGRYDSGEWWTGARTSAREDTAVFALTNPRQAFLRFIVRSNLARSGRLDAWGTALQAIDFGDAAATLSRTEQIQRAQSLFDVVDLTTFRIWSIPDEASGNTLPIRLEQAGSDASLTLTMVRDAKGDWRIRMPSDAELNADRRALLAARGGRPNAADAYKRLQSARDTMRSFLEGMADWDGNGRALALSTLDLSRLPEVLREGQGALNAQYLRRVLNQIGLVGLQSIPDDGADRTPYVHFIHPAGRIVIAPDGPEADAPWKFTAQTMADIDDLYRAIDNLPPPLATPPGLIPPAPFFVLRDFARARAPFLMGSIGSVEYWQIVAALTLLLAVSLIGTLAARLIRLGTNRVVGDPSAQPAQFTWALGISIGLLCAAPFPTVLGLPEEIRRFAFPTIGMVLTLAGSVALWYLLQVAGVVMQRIGDRTATNTDDILFTLLLATARLGVIIAACLGLAFFLSIPTGGILAGFGIGGLAFAFASRETLSNVFGAGILVADRPFHRGDWIISGNIEGSVEHVGIRSTRVRTSQDSIVVVPNGRLADSMIDNLGTRRHRLVKSQVVITAGGTPERLEAFTAAIRDRVVGDDAFVADRTDVWVSGMTDLGILVDLVTYLNVSSIGAERAAKNALMVDVVRFADGLGLTLGAGMQVAAQGAPRADPGSKPALVR